MKNKFLAMLLVCTLFAGILSACSGAQSTVSPGETPVPTVKADTRIVAEGKLVPKDDVQLSFAASGEVDEVLVKVGDVVKAGDVIARLGDREQFESNISNAELELLNAQQAKDRLTDQAEVARIEALRRIADATRALRNAQYQLKNFTVPKEQENLDPFEAVKIYKQKLDEAQAAFDEVKGRSENDSTRRDRKEALDDAQSAYDTAVRRLEYVVAQQTAQADLDKAQKDYEAVKEGEKAEDVKAAEARIKAAEAALESTKAALRNLELVATIDGTIVDLDLIVGENVQAGVPVISIADFSQWYVETDDLTEIDVVRVSVGQKVTVIADALPDLKLQGGVDSIKDISEEKRGDVTYTVRILVENVDPRLRWGMTVIITFED